MSLNNDQLTGAIELLQSSEVTDLFEHQIKDNSKNGSPLSIDLKGLVSMHPPRSTSILYAEPVDSSQRLYSLCLQLRDLFRNKGFLVPDDRPLKLHATIVNTIYAKGNRQPPSQSLDSNAPGTAAGKLDDRSQGHGPNAKAPIRLEARNLVESYKDHTWASNLPIDRLAICEMGAKKVLDAEGNVVEERYTEVAHIRLTT
jgi:activating signal cointegrator complex subunit 1